MKVPTDCRDATFEGLRKDLAGLRRAVYYAWQVFGPATTKHVAYVSDISVLTLRPRTTELYQMGLLTLTVDGEAHPGEGVYRVATPAEWEAWRRQKMGGGVNAQQQLL